jgi:uncharacterized membrane protein YhhN
MKTKALSVLYFLTGTAYIAFENTPSLWVTTGLKGLIMPLLIVILIINFQNSLLTLLMLAALVFSWAGDMILEFSFLHGLACFLLAQVMYIFVFSLTPGRNIIFKNRLYLGIPIALYGAGLVLFMYNDLGEMKLPVIIYAFVILSMLASAINRLRKVNSLSYWLVLVGSALFVISDSVLALNRFSTPFNASDVVVMATYVIAQYLIITGYIRQTADRMV